MEKKFAVVKFPKEKSVQLVPKVWLTENNTLCKWPLVKGGKLNAAIKKCIKPGDDWEEHPACLCRTTDDYKRGLELSKLAEFTSDLDTEEDDHRGKRRCKRKRKETEHNNSSDSDPGDASCPMLNISFVEPEQDLFQHSNNVSNDGTLLQFGTSENISVEDVNVESRIDESGSNLGIYIQTQSSNSFQNTSQDNDAGSEVCILRKEVQEIRGLVAEHLVKLKEEVREIRHSEPSPSSNTNQIILGQLINFIPVPNIVALAEFCKFLVHEENLKLLKSYLGSVGGSSVGEVTRCILMKLFQREFATKINFTGANSKLAFSKSILRFVLIESVRRNFTEKVTEKQVDQEAIKWFKGAKDRYEGRQRPSTSREVFEDHPPKNNQNNSITFSIE
ncbi:unnamed protein product [Allacma fusca]|uniref:DUF4806 domain-containing protein n=1 Tax=Allacma fusca TaxID=39272 RepID=A0A8J2IXQ7_9HEXA|nr:unnamed protein product [Allacma fusca]